MLEHLYAAHWYACLLCALALAISHASGQKKGNDGSIPPQRSTVWSLYRLWWKMMGRMEF